MAAQIVSIIIPHYGAQDLLEQCLFALFEATENTSFEVIVVNDSSPGFRGENLQAKFPSVRIIDRASNGGFAAACNEGAVRASGDLLVFLNNDTVPQTGWL